LTFTATENVRALARSTVRLPDAGRLSGTVDGRGLAILDYSARSTGVVVDLAAGTATGTARALGVLNVIGSRSADRLAGSSDDNILMGNGGADLLVGGAGRDVLLVGAGNDTLDGGSDRDVLIGGRGAVNLRGGAGVGASVIADGFEDDQLVGGSTARDTALAALAGTSASPHADRVGHRRGNVPGGANGKFQIRTAGGARPFSTTPSRTSSAASRGRTGSSRSRPRSPIASPANCPIDREGSGRPSGSAFPTRRCTGGPAARIPMGSIDDPRRRAGPLWVEGITARVEQRPGRSAPDSGFG
jgi:hypothetical protein